MRDKLKKYILIVCLMTFFLSLLSVNALSASNISISVENVTVAIGEEIVVPIRLKNNTGICGATISVSYDDSLSLRAIRRGDALQSLDMTEPGDLSETSVKISYVGTDKDVTNGTIAYLCFDPIMRAGVYNIDLSYDEGDVADDELKPLDVEMIPGAVHIKSLPSTGGGGDMTDSEADDRPTITIGKVSADANTTVDVPVSISQNTDLCGATLEISYDPALTLVEITKGDIFPDIQMTEPGDKTANPFCVSFIGKDGSDENGLFFTLTFKVPTDERIYDISATYKEGDIVDSDLNPLDVSIKNGSIAVGARDIDVKINDQSIVLPQIYDESGAVYITFFDGLKMHNINSYGLDLSEIKDTAGVSITNARIFCWGKNLEPLCEPQKIIFN